MIIYAHRGNSELSDFKLENSPKSIDVALNRGFHAEIDLRVANGQLYLGHDTPQYNISINWLLNRKSRLLCHIKEIEVFSLIKNISRLTFFVHFSDDFSLVSNGKIWVHNQRLPLNNLCITHLITQENIENFRNKTMIRSVYGIVTDYPIKLKDMLENV